MVIPSLQAADIFFKIPLTPLCLMSMWRPQMVLMPIIQDQITDLMALGLPGYTDTISGKTVERLSILAGQIALLTTKVRYGVMALRLIRALLDLQFRPLVQVVSMVTLRIGMKLQLPALAEQDNWNITLTNVTSLEFYGGTSATGSNTITVTGTGINTTTITGMGNVKQSIDVTSSTVSNLSLPLMVVIISVSQEFT